jgi:hypothetical protein
MKYCIYSNARQSFFHTFGACEVPDWTMQSKTKAGSTTCNQKREQSMPKVIRHNFFLRCPLSNFLKKQLALFLSSTKEAPMLVDCLDGAILFHWVPYKQ